ncbi:MAG: hypothetical protein PHV30_02855 [Candidatus Margulisbacteria bacterium]|nr:hypothetical protein [Candidatus Margulisiibacteriota bacterium]
MEYQTRDDIKKHVDNAADISEVETECLLAIQKQNIDTEVILKKDIESINMVQNELLRRLMKESFEQSKESSLLALRIALMSFIISLIVLGLLIVNIIQH